MMLQSNWQIQDKKKKKNVESNYWMKMMKLESNIICLNFWDEVC